MPGNSRKVRKRVNKPEPPIADPLPQVILGLLTLGIQIGRGNSRKNPTFPKIGKNSKTSNQAKGATGATGATGNDTGTIPKEKCTSVMELIQT